MASLEIVNSSASTNELVEHPIENLLFDLAQCFQWPILILVLIAFCYSVMKLGSFAVESARRAMAPERTWVLSHDHTQSVESMELVILRELEGLRLCSRISPMLGLIATMIPLGPALVAVSSGHSENLSVSLGASFAAVIVALVAASITFLIYTVRRRWLLGELNEVLGSGETA